jgi:GxxExxY protein
MRNILKNDDIIYPELSYKINGILFKTRKDLGRFGNEKQYCDGIEKLLKDNGIGYEREKVLPPAFEGEHKGRNKVDFLIENKVVLEVKAKPFVTYQDYYQLRRYLKAFKKKLGILVNMRRYMIAPKRILNSEVES